LILFRFAGNSKPRRRAKINISEPATKNLIPAKSSGGNALTPIRIARYVDPHNIQTAINADITFDSSFLKNICKTSRALLEPL